MEIKIQSNVKPPPERPKFQEHLAQLEVGQSFAVPLEYWSSLRNAANHANRKSDKRFSVHKQTERDSKTKKMVEVARVWRNK